MQLQILIHTLIMYTRTYSHTTGVTCFYTINCHAIMFDAGNLHINMHVLHTLNYRKLCVVVTIVNNLH